jgi:two-component system OmpR family response regulator
MQQSKKQRPMNVLLVEDDKEVSEFICNGLRENGYLVDHVADGDMGLRRAKQGQFDAMIIDRMLPRRDGLSIIQSLRAADIQAPVLVLSALGEVDDRVKGLKVGADDYLVKPFAMEELLARIEVLIRRGEQGNSETRLTVGDLEMDLLAHKVTRAGQVFNLQPREYRLLEYLMKHAGQVVTRTMLLENVWDYHFDPQTNVIDVHISRLRQKIDKGFDTQLLNTVRGTGYVLNAPE